MAEANKRKVVCVTTGEKFDCARTASKCYNIDSSGITKCCRKKRQYCGKLPNGDPLVWKYNEEDD